MVELILIYYVVERLGRLGVSTVRGQGVFVFVVRHDTLLFL